MKNFYKKTLLSVFALFAISTIGFGQTTVQFEAASANVTEAGITYDLAISITNEDGVNATTADVVLTGGLASDIGDYTAQMITFPAASATNQTVTITITDDADIESAETLTFSLQNVAGGNAAVLGAQTTFDLVIVDNDITASDFIINEVHADPAGDISGDANGDGIRSGTNDEFIELVNTGGVDLDVSGYEIFDTNSSLTSRHIFPNPTVVPAGGAVVVFGGGTPTGTFGNSIIQTSSSGGVGTTNTSETLIVQDAADNTVIYFTYGAEGGDNQSITRVPDVSGTDSPMTKHSVAVGSGGALFSPGTKVDGISEFVEPAAPTTSVKFSSASVVVAENSTSFDLTISIVNPDGGVATTADVVLTDGTAVDIDNYTTQMVTFPAGDGADQTVTVTITDDADIESREGFTFTLQNVAGGNSAVTSTQTTFFMSIVDDEITASDWVLNELQADPASNLPGDANGDGIRSASEDEFFELVNNGLSDLDMTGYSMFDMKSSIILRHVFPESTVVPAGGAIVVFGGGTPTGSFGNSIVQTASTGSVGLTNSDDGIIILDASGNTIISYAYLAEADDNQSITRDPDITGGDTPMTKHSVATGSGGSLFSPGAKIDGSPFIAPSNTEVQFSTALSSVNEGTLNIDLTVTISGEDANNATTADIVLTGGTGTDADINTYTTQQVSFPAASSDAQTVTLTITDDMDIEGDETLEFSLQNVTGGNAAVVGAQGTLTLTVIDNDFSPTALVINEFHPYPSTGSVTDPIEVDANGDGTLNGLDDEFIELVNSGTEDLTISGWKINDGVDRHVFPDPTVIPAGGAIVVFGRKEAVGTFGNSIVQTATNTDGLGLANTGDTFTIKDESDNVRLSYTYEAATVGVAFTRSPDVTGAEPLIAHPDNPSFVITEATQDAPAVLAKTSPGTKIDGSLFIEPVTTVIQFSSSTSSVNEGGTTIDLTVSIVGEDASNATTADIVLTGGTGTDADINTYTTQQVSFPAASAVAQTVTLTITDDVEVEGDETLIFSIQNVSGGNSAIVGSQDTHTLTVVDNDFAPTDLVVNEYIPWPAGSNSSATNGESRFDSNGDGNYDFGFDEYIELVNSGMGDLDISGWKINDGIDRHIFPNPTVIPAGGAIVVFGGGTPDGTFGNSIVQTASESTSLGFGNSGDEVFIKDDTDATRLTFSYGQSTRPVAFVRSPDITGDFVEHPAISAYSQENASDAQASPGLKIDGTLFIEPVTTVIQFASAMASVNEADGTFDINISILKEDANNATTADVVLTGGTGTDADINTYTTQRVSFPAASADAQTVTLTITDDMDIEGDETLEFSLQNVAGGNAAVVGAQSTLTLTVVDNDFPPTSLVVNEFMPWPAAANSSATNGETQFDSNGDGIFGSGSDEYIEFVNSGTENLNISGWKINDGVDRHVFEENTEIPAGGAIIVFGGGSPQRDFGNSIVQVSSVSTSLGLLNSGDEIFILDDTDAVRLTFSYGQAVRAVAMTRDPDITAMDFGNHAALSKFQNEDLTDAQASPGWKVDGSYFIEPTTTIIQFTTSSISVNEGDTSFDLNISIVKEDPNVATTADVVLTSGAATDFNNYTTQPVVFAAGSNLEQTVTIQITDDMEVEGEEVFTFELQNITGGNEASVGSNTSVIVMMADNDFPPSDLIVNEFLPYPSSTSISDPAEVDANGDGTLSGLSDEFMEFVNGGTEDMDISGWYIVSGSSATVRHYFPSGTILAPGAAIVVFGGGTPTGTFGGATIQDSSESTSLGLTNSGTTFSIFDNATAEIFSYTYPTAQVGVSYTRNPDITGEFEQHPSLGGLTISPGTKVDGTPFAVDNSTKVAFATPLGGIEESDTSFDFEVTITNPDANNATTADIVLTSENTGGDLTYSVQTVTFPAGSNDNQVVTVGVNNDSEIEGDELFTFAIQNISGGDKAKTGNPFLFDFIILDDDVPLIFNEIHADPASGDAGDANNDGIRDASQDEFIEIVNKSSETVDMSGYKYQDNALLRHIFPNGTELQPGHAIVVFGGGEPKGILGAQVQVASEGNGIGLTNAGDQLSIFNADDEIQSSTIYGKDADNDQSITRSPDITGGYTLHTQADGSDGSLYSPGRKVNETVFINIVTNTNDELDIEQLHVYPNPVSDYLKISTDSKPKGLQLRLYNVNGKMIRNHELKSSTTNQISISDLRTGLYTYQIFDSVGQMSLKTGKLSIQN